MRTLLQLNEEELLWVMVEAFKAQNPTMQVGERLQGPTACMWKGKHVVPTSAIDQDVIGLDFLVPHYEPPSEVVVVQSMKIGFNKLDKVELGELHKKFLYPYNAVIPHKKWLSQYKAGDKIMAVDSEFAASEITLTQEIIDQHSYVVFRFGISS